MTSEQTSNAPVLDAIQRRMEDITSTHGVRILHASESGSRAWGFASPDSDYDVRFIYVHPPEWYYSVFEQRDVIETPIEEVDGVVFDVNGWDLRKALRLLAKGNPVLVEWLHSPIRYRQSTLDDSPFHRELLVLAQQYFSAKTTHYHYFHMARKNFREHLQGQDIKLKKYFYVLRPVLACRWLEQQACWPPMTLTDLMAAVLPAGSLQDDILKLRAMKMQSSEIMTGPRIDSIHEFLTAELSRLAGHSPPTAEAQDFRLLDAFLRRWTATPQ